MTGVPEYLKPYSSMTNQKSSRLSFHLKCTCGCDVFSIVGNSYTQEEKRLKKEYEEKIPDTGRHSIHGGVDAGGKPYCYIKKFFFFKKYIELPHEPVFMGINVIKAATGAVSVDLEQDEGEDVSPEMFLWIRIAVKNGHKKQIIFDSETG